MRSNQGIYVNTGAHRCSKAGPSPPYLKWGQLNFTIYSPRMGRCTGKESKQTKKLYIMYVLRTCWAYRTMSDKAACVMVRLIPIDILVKGEPLPYEWAYAVREFLRADGSSHGVKLSLSGRGGGVSQKNPSWDISRWIQWRYGKVGGYREWRFTMLPARSARVQKTQFNYFNARGSSNWNNRKVNIRTSFSYVA